MPDLMVNGTRQSVDADPSMPLLVLGAAGRRLRYAELVDDVAKLPVPDATSVLAKSRAAWRYIGKPMPIVDLDDIVHGRAVYGIDVVLPGMKYASVERPPSYGGTVRSYDASDALRIPGVERVVQIPGTPPPSGFKPLGAPATPGLRCRGGNNCISIGSRSPTQTTIRQHIGLNWRRQRRNLVMSHATMVTR